ncbi:hypothetical protein GLOIN_2v1779898 [Rhizophagus irregularis DAOM 181602=DAOM 197198]|nr:hypothetical protein GLOIN_2v1779898 [Rhizophagus irregularis DAOM 181602=DAOM 197198]
MGPNYLIISQTQTIIGYFSKNPNIGLPDDQDDSIIDSEEEISNEQTNTSEVRVNTLVSDKANVSTVSIPLTYVSDSVKSQVTENRVCTTIFFCRNHPKALQLLTFIVVFNVVHFREYVTGGKMRENASFRLRNGPKYKDIILR